MPASKHLRQSSSKALAVIATMGICRAVPSSFRRIFSGGLNPIHDWHLHIHGY
jgi:hypothetical protein